LAVLVKRDTDKNTEFDVLHRASLW